jgi:DNA-binding NarL/FixJ family response regulator
MAAIPGEAEPRPRPHGRGFGDRGARDRRAHRAAVSTTYGPPAPPLRAGGPALPTMIRVAVLDDHPAVRLGLRSALAGEPGLVHVGSAPAAAELPSLLYRTDPDVVLLDHQLPDADGLSLCHGLKAREPRRKVILYSAWADDAMVVPAAVAGADGLVAKTARPHDLFAAIRHVARGGRWLPEPTPAQLEVAGGALDPEDLPILAMTVAGTPHDEIAETVGVSDASLARRIRGMLARMRAPVATPSP